MAIRNLEMLADMQMIIPAGNPNRPGTGGGGPGWPPFMRGGSPNEIVVHDTANTSPGADAIMHGHFLASGGGGESVSFHAGVDSRRSVQYLPWNETCWAAGDGLGVGNTDSINIELCINRDGDYATMLLRAVVLIAKLCSHFGIPTDAIRQHHDRSSYGKDCPHTIRTVPGKWDQFIKDVKEAIAKMATSKVPTPDTGPVLFKETGVTVSHDFYQFWSDHGGLAIFGYPIKAETEMTAFNGASLRVQSFERARFEQHPDGVKLGLVEVERLKLLGKL